MGVGGGRLGRSSVDGVVGAGDVCRGLIERFLPPQLEGREFTPRIISLDRDVDPASPKSLLQSGS